jgi:hypothetical protein
MIRICKLYNVLYLDTHYHAKLNRLPRLVRLPRRPVLEVRLPRSSLHPQPSKTRNRPSSPGTTRSSSCDVQDFELGRYSLYHIIRNSFAHIISESIDEYFMSFWAKARVDIGDLIPVNDPLERSANYLSVCFVLS